MNLIHIAAKTFDLSGALTIRPRVANSQGAMTRRVTRSATLDGGAAVSDRGFTHSDRTMTVEWQPVSAAEDAIARRLHQYHSRVLVSTEEGCFEAVPETLDLAASGNSFTLLIVDKLDEG